jgi:hypothetical protein
MAPAHGIWVPKCESHQAFTSKMGAIRYANYHDRPRLGQERFEVHGIDAAGLAVVRKSAVITSIRARLAEFGEKESPNCCIVADPSDKRGAGGWPCVPCAALGDLLLGLKRQILELNRMIMAWHRSNQTSKRLHYIPGVGPVLATAVVASVADPRILVRT